jgi:molybdate transport system substrate-binding protein
MRLSGSAIEVGVSKTSVSTAVRKIFFVIGATMALAQGTQAAEIKLLSSAAIKPVIEVLGPQFERATGNKLVAKFELTPAVKTQIEAGEAFDVAIANPAHIDDLIKQGKIAAGTGVDIARFGVGIGVRAGAPKPDISSVDGLKRTLLNAKSVAYVGEGTSGVFVRNLLEKLKITEDMRTKLKPGGIAASLSAVAQGEAEIVVMPVPLILANLGVELAGPVPTELQDHIALTAGISPKAPEAAQALIKFLMAPEVNAVLSAKGYERVTR